ncbi:MAG: M48 family metalloprotease [Myxococcota bacterium]|nr:M48 family metalloprotease [Myxococcota bacterium]
MAAGRRRRGLSGAVARPALGLALLLPGLAGCPGLGGGNPIREFTKVGVESERETGYQADVEIREQLRLIDDPAVLRFVHELGQTLVDALGEQPFVYHFRVIEDPSLNAFALPGGYIYFHSGTILEAASLDELAGVMAHEVAHVKGRHWARMVEHSTVPNLLSSIAGILATAATGEPGALIVSQGVNVALQLRFTREFEAEADRLGTTFMARTGFDPRGMAVFFERIVAKERTLGPRMQVPPYLYTHPDVELRVDAAYGRAEKLTVTGRHEPDLDAAFRAAQLRLAMIVRSGRSEIRAAAPKPDRSLTDPALAEAKRLAEQEKLEAALAVLWEAARAEPRDSRVPFRIGELLERAGRPREAIDAYRRALALEPGVALTHYRVGMLHRQLGEPAEAAFHLEQAERRFEKGGQLRAHTRRVLERLTFPILDAAGLADGATDAPGADTPAGRSRERFGRGDARVVWWGRLSEHWGGLQQDLRVRFVAPDGEVVQEERPRRIGRGQLASALPLDAARIDRGGTWQVEVRLGEDVVDRRRFAIGDADAEAGATEDAAGAAGTPPPAPAQSSSASDTR